MSSTRSSCSRSKARTRYARLPNFTSLHILVVSLRCEHSCPYCQVSRQSTDRDRFDMSPETAQRAVELVFESPSPHIKIEFQGGEPLLNFPVIEQVVLEAERLNEHYGKDLSFVIATNLALLDDEILDFCEPTGHLHLDLSRRPGGSAQQKPAAARWKQLGTRRRRDPTGSRDARRPPSLSVDDDDRAKPRTVPARSSTATSSRASPTSSCGRSRPTDSRSRRRAMPPTTSNAGSPSTRAASTTSSS